MFEFTLDNFLISNLHKTDWEERREKGAEGEKKDLNKFFVSFWSWNRKWGGGGRHLKAGVLFSCTRVCIYMSWFCVARPSTLKQSSFFLSIICGAGSVGGYHLVCFPSQLFSLHEIQRVWVLSSQLNIPASGLVLKRVGGCDKGSNMFLLSCRFNICQLILEVLVGAALLLCF